MFLISVGGECIATPYEDLNEECAQLVPMRSVFVQVIPSDSECHSRRVHFKFSCTNQPVQLTYNKLADLHTAG